MPKRRIGLRQTRVQFYRPTITGQNSSGEDIVEMVLLASAWVGIEALTGRELVDARQIWAEARFRITMEHPLSSFTARRKDLIYWGSPARVLDILDGEDPNQRREQVVLMAKDYTD